MTRGTNISAVLQEEGIGFRTPMFGTEKRFTAPDINGNAEAYHPRHNICNHEPYTLLTLSKIGCGFQGRL